METNELDFVQQTVVCAWRFADQGEAAIDQQVNALWGSRWSGLAVSRIKSVALDLRKQYMASPSSTREPVALALIALLNLCETYLRQLPG